MSDEAVEWEPETEEPGGAPVFRRIGQAGDVMLVRLRTEAADCVVLRVIARRGRGPERSGSARIEHWMLKDTRDPAGMLAGVEERLVADVLAAARKG